MKGKSLTIFGVAEYPVIGGSPLNFIQTGVIMASIENFATVRYTSGGVTNTAISQVDEAAELPVVQQNIRQAIISVEQGVGL